MPNSDTFQTLPFPRSRRVMMDATRMGMRKPIIFGLLSFDITEARRILHEHKEKTGESLSFTAFLAANMARAVAEVPIVQAYLAPFKRLVLFDDVDVTTVIPIELEGRPFPMSHILRGANRRSVVELHEEIRAVQANPHASHSRKRWGSLKWFYTLPAFLRNLIYGILFRFPKLVKANTGTVSLSAIGMFADGGGWGINLPFHNCSVVVGGISERPAVVAGEIVVREFVDLTFAFNHDVIDGVPAANFAMCFKELVESAAGLS